MYEQQPKLHSVVMGAQQQNAGNLQFMDTSAFDGRYSSGQAGGNAYYPSEYSGNIGGNMSTNFEDEPPLLEELGIDFDKIKQKTISVLNPLKKVTKDMIYSPGNDGEPIADSDMAGPILIALMLGGAMLLRGKVTPRVLTLSG